MKSGVPEFAITEAGLRKKMQKAIGPDSTATAWARENRITAQQVSAFGRKVQGPGLLIPKTLGYKPQIVYVPLDEDDIYVKPPKRGPVGPTKDQLMKIEADARKKAKKKDKKKRKKQRG